MPHFLLKRFCLAACLVLWLLSGCAAPLSTGTEMLASAQGEMLKPTLAPGTPPSLTQMQGRLRTSTLAGIQQRGVLLVGTAIAPPYGFYDSQRKTLVGLDVDVIHYVAGRLGVEVEWVTMPFGALLPALQENRIDVTIAGMHITPERERVIDFSAPYLSSGLVMLVRPELAWQIRQVDDLSNRRVGVKIGATGERFAEDLKARGVAIEIKRYKETVDSLLDLEVGRLDVVFNDYINSLNYLQQNNSSLVIARDEGQDVILLTRVGLGIGVAQGNQELVSVINDALSQMRQDGTYAEICNRWLTPDSTK